jgi:hypothetical protein
MTVRPAARDHEQGENPRPMYGEPITAAASAGRPARFGWRGENYVVQAVLANWVVSGEWWQRSAGPDVQPELEFWRVRASPADEAPVVYDLRHHVASGIWLLVRIWD